MSHALFVNASRNKSFPSLKASIAPSLEAREILTARISITNHRRSSSSRTRPSNKRPPQALALRDRPFNKDSTRSPAIDKPLNFQAGQDYARRLSKLPANARRIAKVYRITDLGIHSRMKSHIQFVTTPTSDTAGTALYLHFDDKRYIFGHIHEGLQRAGLQAGARFLKAKDLFLTGKTEWKNTGGLLGMMLTLADGENAAAASKEESMNKKAKRAAERAEVRRQTNRKWSIGGSHESTPTPEAIVVERDLSLRVHGGPNLIHTVATARSFIFRKGMPIDVEEYSEENGKTRGENSRQPNFVDNRIQLWAMPIRPGESSPSRPVSPRKRSLGEFMSGQRPTGHEILEQWGVQPDRISEDLEHDQAIRRKVVSEMFRSDWRYDRLTETSLLDVKLPASLFVRHPETKELQKYTGPMPETDPWVSNIKVLVREPWPGTLIDHLPPTKPSPVSMSYIVRGHKQRGRFKPQEAKRLGVPHGPLYSKLSQGLSVELADGTTVTPDMVLEPSREGSGFAVIDLPSKEYISDMLHRPEWKEESIMSGIKAIIWLLGPDVVRDETLLRFMDEFKDIKHVVSSNGVCVDDFVMRSAAAEFRRHHQIDPDRYPALRHTAFPDSEPQSQTTTSDNTDEGKVPFIVAKQGMKIELEPSVAVDQSDVSQGNSRSEMREMPEGALRHAQEARESIDSEATQLELAVQDLPSPDAEIICLGTGSALPSLHRNVSATLLRVPGSGSYLLDCGENTLGQLRRLYSPPELDNILKDLKLIWISHLHADHHLGTTAVIKAWYEAVYGAEARSILAESSPKLDAKNDLDLDVHGRKLFIVSHHQMAKWLKEYSTVEDFGYDKIIPLTTGDPQSTVFSSCSLEWEGVDLGFHSRDISQSSIQLATGLSDLRYCYVAHCYGSMAVTLVFPTGFKFSYSGDCRPSREFVRIGKGSTVLLHEATFDDDTKGDAKAKKHSTISEAIGVGVAMGARRVLLTHFSQRYSKMPSMDDIDRASLKLDDAEDVTGIDGDGRTDPIDAVPRSSSDDALLQGLKSDNGASSAGTRLPSKDATIVESTLQPDPPKPNTDMKIGVAFDYMRVKVKDIALLEKFTPAMKELYKEQEKEVVERPDSAASVRVDKTGKHTGKSKTKTEGMGIEIRQERKAQNGKKTIIE